MRATLTDDVATALHEAFGDRIGDDYFSGVVDAVVEAVRRTAEDDLLACPR